MSTSVHNTTPRSRAKAKRRREWDIKLLDQHYEKHHWRREVSVEEEEREAWEYQNSDHGPSFCDWMPGTGPNCKTA